MRESTIMKIHYGTAIAAVALSCSSYIDATDNEFAESLEYEL